MPEMQKQLGVTTLVSEISCVVDRAKLPNLVIVAVVGFIYFWRKAFQPVAGRRCDEIQFEWIHLVDYYSRKPSFTPKKRKPVSANTGWLRWSKILTARW